MGSVKHTTVVAAFGSGCLTITAVVIRVSGNQIILQNWDPWCWMMTWRFKVTSNPIASFSSHSYLAQWHSHHHQHHRHLPARDNRRTPSVETLAALVAAVAMIMAMITTKVKAIWPLSQERNGFAGLPWPRLITCLLVVDGLFILAHPHTSPGWLTAAGFWLGQDQGYAELWQISNSLV